MSVGSDLWAVLQPMGISLTENTYSGPDTKYMTYNYTSHGNQFGDNHALTEKRLIQLHLIAPASVDLADDIAQIKSLLDAAGYPYPSMIDASEDPATEQHLVFETEDVIGVGDD